MLVMIAVTAIVQLQAQTYSFTTCGATGSNGPSQTQVNLAYASSTITGVVSNNGIQEWTVPATGFYSIKVAGAKGGGAGGGNGAVLSGEFLLMQGHVIQIVVGQRGTGGFGAQGSVNSGGGGGGSFVVNKTTSTILLIAGGGGGGNGDYGVSYPNTVGNPANTGTSGNSTYQTGGGTNGNGGKNGVTDDPAAGGGGYFTNGENSPGTAFAGGGQAFLNGARGGAGRTGSYFGGDGGFGGGGGGTSNVLVRGGGGGGYSGGQGGTYQIVQTSVYTSSSDRGHGAGAGSINNGSNPITYATNAAAGYVTVTTLSTPAGALNFVKANNNYITVPHSASLNLGAEFTIESWVNYTGVNSTIIDKGDYDYLLQVNCNNPGFSPNRLNFYNRNTGWVHSTGTVPEGVWTHVAVTLKNGTMTFYINGVASGTAAVNFAQDNGPVNIGRQSPSSCACNIFNGNMDELRVWNRALSACEINSNKSCELSGTQTGLAAYYKFNQGSVNMNNSSVNTLIDASGNNNTGSLIGFALTGTTSNWVAGQVSGTCGPIVPPTPTISTSGSTTICAGGSVTLTASAGGSYLWSNGATTQSITVSTTGAYTVTVTNASGCSGTSAATNVAVTTINNQTVSAAPVNICGTGSSTVTLASSQAGIYYTLRNNANNAIVAGPIPGTGAAINFNTGNISATTTYNVLAETKPTGALSFNGSTYVTIPHAANLNVSAGGQLTMEAWVNPAVSGQWRNILMKGAYGYGMAIDASNRLYFWDQGGGNAYDTWSDVTVPANTWSHVAITVQDNGSSLSVKLYLNGVNVGNKTSPVTQINDNAESLIIGRQGTGCGCNYFNGKLDDVRVWNTVRTASEIAASMNSCLSGAETGLLALYKMDDGNGSTVTDSKSANNGTITGTASWTSGNVVCGAVCSLQMSATPTVTVVPTPTVNPITNQEVCHNAIPVTAIAFSGNLSGTVYNWTNSNPSIGLAASGTGDIAAFLGQNTGTVPVYATITVTPSYTSEGNTCTGAPVSFIIRVNPIPVIDPIDNLTVCNGTVTAPFNISSPVAGSVFRWTQPGNVPNVNVGLPNGDGATVPSFTAINTGTTPLTATYYAVSYYSGETMGCGTSRQFDVTVNPTPVANITAGGSTTFCAGGSVTLTASGGATYLWNNGATTNSINVTAAGTYSATATSAEGCVSAPASITLTQLPAPTVNPVTNKEVCHNGIAVPAINFTGAVNGTIYNWTNDNPSIGLAASGTGDIASFTALNPGTAPVYANITVTPSYTVDGNTCTGTPVSFVIRVNPIPVFNAIANQSLCNGASSTAINLTSPVAGTTFTWFNTTPAVNIGLANGSGATIPSFTAVNNTNAPVTATYLALSYYQGATMGCGTSRQFSYTVNPTPQVTVTASGPTTFCAGGSVTLTASAGTSYAWSNGATTPSITVNQTGNYSVTVTGTGGCTNTSAPTTVTVNALPAIPVISSAGSTTVCVGSPVTLSAGGASAGNAIDFDGSNDNIVIPNNAAFSFTSQYTAESWINLRSYQYGTIISKFEDDNNNRGWMVNIGETGAPTVHVVHSRLGTWTNPIQWNSGFQPALNTWYHIAVVFDASLSSNHIKLYVNGALTAQTSWPYTLTPNAANMYFGGYDNPGNGVNGGANGRFFNGRLDEVRIWNVARTAAQISANYNQVISAPQSGLVAAYSFSETAGNAIQDVTGVHNGTMVNNPTRIANGPQISGGSGNNTYLWSTGETGSSITVNQVGNYSVTVTNENGCAATSAPVTVSNYAQPTISCPANISVVSAANQCGVNVTYPNATVTSGPANPTITYSHPSGSFFPVGNTTVTATVTDACGNTATCTFVVTVRDETPPVLACTNQSSSSPVNFMRGTSTGGTAAIVAWTGLNGASQYAGSSLGTSCNESWRPFGTLCDEAPNTNSMTTSTKSNANSGITFNSNGPNGIGAFVVDLGATQNFNLAQVYQMFSDGKTTHVRGFYHPSTAATAPSITDAGWIEMFPETVVGAGVYSGNNVTQPTEITFGSTSARYVRFYVRNDGRYGSGTWIETRSIKLFSTAPAINNVTVTAADGQCTAIATYDVQAIDNCSGTVVSYSIPSGSSFPIGTTPVQVTATDASGNTTTCSFSVIVNAPEINVTGNSNNITSGTTTTAAANNTNFGGTLPNTPVSKNFVIQNTGTAALKISSISLSGIDAPSFSINGITLPVIVAPNASVNFNVVFSSNAPGVKEATVTINNSDCNETAYQFAISAEITCTNPVFINLNPQVQANTTATTCNAVVNYPLAVNGIPTPGLSYTFSGATTGSGSGTGTGNTFNKGTTHVIVTAINPCSTVVYEFDVIVTDNILPIAISQNITVQLDANGTATINASQINNGSTDNCGIASISLDKSGFDCSNLGANTVQLTVTDVNGNSATATATVTVVDNIQPLITAPVNVTVNTTVNCTATAVVLGTPITSDNCSVQSVTNNAPAVFTLGTTIVTWTVTDVSGNTATATQTVLVKDVTAPVPNVATLPDITAECNVTVTTIPRATDNCSGLINATTTSPLTYNSQGTYTITWRYTDASGNSSTQTQTVIVRDVTPPVVSCPAPITVTVPANQCGAVVTFNQPTVTDNCSSGSTGVHTLASGAQFFDYADNRMENQYSPGLPMSFFPTDGQKLAVFLVNCGSTHYMYQNITLPSSGPINLGLDMKYTNHYASGFSSNQFIAIELRNPSTNAIIATLFKTNPGAPQSTPMTHYNFDLSAYAGQQVRLQVVDATINNFYLDVLLDNITLPGSSLVNGSFETGNYNGWTIGSASTTCGTFGIGSGPSVSIVQTGGLPSGSTFPIGTTTNTFEVTDLAGNKTTCSFNVSVNAPEINISGNGTAIVSGDNTPTASDNTDLGGTIPGNSISKTFVIANNGTSALTVSSINISNAAFTRTGISLPATIQPGQTASFTVSFSSMTLGVQTAVVTINNNDCNESNYSFTVKGEVTCTNPVFVNTNAQVLANTTATTCNAVVNYPLAVTGIPAPGVSYSFSGATTGAGAGTGSGQTFNKGTTHVVVTAVNPCSTVVNEFDVIVSDNTNPIAIAQNLTVQLDANGAASITAAQVNNGSTDNCGIASVSVNKTSFDCSNVGVNTINLTVTDVNGNTSTTTATVTVVDQIAPSITAPVNISQGTDAGVCGATVNLGTPVTADNCSVATVTNNAPTLFPVGTTVVTWTVTDVNGNSSTTTQTVVIADTEKPRITAPALVSVVNIPGSCMASVDLGTPVTSDNCGVATVTNNAPALFPVGTTIVRWTVTDIHGNITDTATQEVVVIDNENPSISVNNISVNNDAGKCGATVSIGQPQTADNCGVATVMGVRSDNKLLTEDYPVGTTTITWTVRDVNGNIKTTTQTVVVTDNEKPTITAPAMVSVVNAAGFCGATVNLGTPVTADNCGVATVTNNAPAIFPVGTTIVTWTVTDIHGNITDTATQEVVVIDNEKPTINVNNISVNNDAGKCGAAIVISLPETADNCGVATVMGERSDLKLLTADYPVGTTTITWTVRDVNGNIKTATQTIVVTDNEKPVIACAANQVFCANTGGNTQYSIPVLSQSDNCGIASTTYSITGATNRTGTGTNASGNFAIGTSTVTFTVTDIHGNSSTCSFTVTINPLPVASIGVQTADAFCNQFTLTANSTLSGPFTYQWLYNNNTRATTQQLSLGLTDADGLYSVYTTDANGCRSELPASYNYQKQTLVSSYTILGTKEVKLGQYNKVETGSVGVMSSRGEAEFDKYSSVTGAGSFVKAPRIDTDKGVTINSKIYGVANVTLPTMQYNTSNTRYLQDKTINSNVTTTVSGNYDEVTLKKGSNVTLTGTIFGKIKLEEGASVRFTSSTIDVEEIQIEKGPKSGGYSYIHFAPNTSVRVSKKVTIGSDVIVNPEAYQVTFYMADNRRDEEKFHVKGDDTRITANIILPNGKLKVTGGNYGDDRCDHRPHSSNSCKHRGHGHHDCDHRGHGDRDCRDDVFMTGLFIAEEVESEGKHIIWNSYNCAAPSAPVTALTSNNNKASVTEEVAASGKLQATSKSEEELKVTVMPNPTRTYFTIKLESKYDAPVTLRVVDAVGRVIESRAKMGSNSTIQVGHNFLAGNYFAEFVQGNRRKTIQLIKVR